MVQSFAVSVSENDREATINSSCVSQKGGRVALDAIEGELRWHPASGTWHLMLVNME